MEAFKSILVDIDAAVPAHPALERAVRLARRCGATLTIVDVMNVPAEARHYLPAAMRDGLVGRRREQLQQVARAISGVPVDSKLLDGRPATMLIREVLRSGHDLLMRSHARDMVARPAKPYGAVDMELFRKCPCPVLVVGPGAPPSRPTIVGAVYASAEDAVEQALNAKIVELTLRMARLEQGSPMLLQAWEPYAAELVRSHASDDDFVGYVEAAGQRATEDLARLTASFGDRLSGVQATLRKGAPEDVIPQVVVAEGVDLVVIGTVARSGLAGVLIGNTAERVLRNLPCSVLAVKPDGFQSPVRLEGPG
jgi:nucleotide-binding universal stress UspA family protein